MKRFGLCCLFAGVFVGQTFNGSTTERFGLYLIAIVAVWMLVSVAVTGVWVALSHWFWFRERRRHRCVVIQFAPKNGRDYVA